MSGAQWDHLHAVVLPALLHELRLPWHAALWGGADADGGGGGLHAAAAAPALLLRGAARTRAAASVAGDQGAGSVQGREARLLQLRLSVRHLLQLIPESAQAAPACATRLLAPPTPNALSASLLPHPAEQARGPWVTLACLAARTLLAHVPSLPGPSAAATLSHALQRLMTYAAHGCPTSPGGSAAAAAAVAEVGAVADSSSHVLLRSLVGPLVLPALEALVHGAALQQQHHHHHHHQHQQQDEQQGMQLLPQHEDAALVAQGRCWALLGAARLQLLVPPPGRLC